MKQSPQLARLLYSSSVAIDLRWYYGTIAFLFSLISIQSVDPLSLQLTPIVAFGGYLLINIFFLRWHHALLSRDRAIESLGTLNVLQTGLDFTFISILTILSGEMFLSMSFILYFIPLILTVLFLELSETLFIAILSSGVLFFTKVFMQGGGEGIAPLFGIIVVTAMYFIASVLGGSVARSVRSRERILAEKMYREEEHIRKLSILAKEFDASAKLLVRRDLDLTRAHRELERIDQMKSEIISVVAHQLRTPLSAVKWTLKMLSDGDAGAVSSEQKMMMMKAYDSNERMIALVNDMLSADRMESGKFRYRFFPIQLEDLIESVVTEILSKANDRGVGVRFLRSPQNLPRVSIDPDKIREVLQNLIDNAIKYSRKGGTVTISVSAEEGWVHCRVSDQGIGIPKEEQDKIFGRFFRAQNALRVETDGSGLGLFIVRGIIQRHGGDVMFESAEGKGTTMEIKLPLDPLSRVTPT